VQNARDQFEPINVLDRDVGDLPGVWVDDDGASIDE
jgi:hypothetical protein